MRQEPLEAGQTLRLRFDGSSMSVFLNTGVEWTIPPIQGIQISALS
jgi:hypothetical protein